MSNTLKVTIDEECFINGMDLGGRKTITVSTGINQFTRQVKTTDGTELSTLVVFDSASPAAYTGAAQYDSEKVRYIRITNLSRDVDAMLHFHGGQGNGSHQNAYFSLPANTSMMIFGNVDTSSPGSDKTGVTKSFAVLSTGDGDKATTLRSLDQINAVTASDIQIETIVATV